MKASYSGTARHHSVQIIGCDKRWEVTPLRCYQVLMTVFLFVAAVLSTNSTIYCIVFFSLLSKRVSGAEMYMLDQEFV